MTGVFEQAHSDALPDLPFSLGHVAYGDDGTRWLVGGHDGALGPIYPLPYLVVGVAESRCANFDEEIIWADCRHWDRVDLVLGLILRCY